jgi:L-threonylcarbamoyladenylate synthase
MKTELIPASHPGVITRALEILHAGGLVAFPTDTVYGVAADAFSAAGIERLYEAKGRDTAKAIPVLLGTLDQLNRVAVNLPAHALQLAIHFWPGAMTLVVPRHPALPEGISQTPTVGVRMPDHPLALALLRLSGPLATTSANLSGAPNPLTAQDVLVQLDGRIELVIDGGTCPGGVPSTVVDATQPNLVVLRQGPISLEDLTRFLANS